MKFLMKVWYIFFLGCMLACNSMNSSNNRQDKEENHQEKPNDFVVLNEQDQIKLIHKKFSFNDSISVLKFDEKGDGKYPYYEYEFMVYSHKSKYQQEYKEMITFQTEQELHLSPYEDISRWNVTNDSLKKLIDSKYPNILTEWVPLFYYKGKPTLYEPGDFHGGYYVFTDSVIYDNTMMDGPDIYRYKKISAFSEKHLEIWAQDVLNNEDERLEKMELFLLDDGKLVIWHHKKYLNGEDGWYLLIPFSTLDKYPLIVFECSELPMGIELDDIDFQKLIQ